MRPPQIVLCKDGSHSLFQEELATSYHSLHGALSESNHVFVHAGLEYSYISNPQKDLRILELGFGTGLNALLTFLSCFDRNVQLNYTGIELFPLAVEIVNQLNYPQVIGHRMATEFFQSIHQATWNTPTPIMQNMILNKLHVNWLSFESRSSFHLVYLDFFGPQSQPELWQYSSLEKIRSLLVPNGILTTFCAQGEFKRNLKKLDFEVESLAGPVGKREMVRAIKK